MLHMNFGGNPIIQQLLQNSDTDIDRLLDIDSFPAQFKNNNPKLEKYMGQAQYQRLIQYVTILGDPQNKNKAFKYPLIAAEILSIDNKLTQQKLLNDKPIIIQTQQLEQRWIQKQVDECDSEYCSSEGSRKLDFQDMMNQVTQQENIPPSDKKQRTSIQSNNNVEIKQKRSNSSNSHRNSDASITSDDFPLADAQKKIVKVKQTIRRKVTREYKPMLQQLFGYFNGELNHTLAGYVCKVIDSILKKHPIKLVQYICRAKLQKSILKHVESYSVCDFLINLAINSQAQNQFSRQELLSMILKISLNASVDPISAKNYMYTFSEIVNKLDPINQKWHQRLIKYIYSQDNLSLISEASLKQHKNIIRKQIGIQLLLLILKKASLPPINTSNKINIIIIKTPQEEQKAQILKKNLKNKIQICFKDYIGKIWDAFVGMTSQEENNEKLPSSFVIKALQIANFLLKENLYWSRIQLINEVNAYRILCQLCKKYPANNLLHNQIFEIFKLAIHEAQAEKQLIQKLFSDKSVFSFFLQTLHNNTKLYRGQVITICHLIKNSHLQYIRTLRTNKHSKWQKIEETLHSDLQKTNKNLGGHIIRKNMKPIIFFQKQQILQHFKYFLKRQIPEKGIVDAQEEQVEDLTSSRGSINDWTDWNDFNNYNADQLDQQ